MMDEVGRLLLEDGLAPSSLRRREAQDFFGGGGPGAGAGMGLVVDASGAAAAGIADSAAGAAEVVASADEVEDVSTVVTGP